MFNIFNSFIYTSGWPIACWPLWDRYDWTHLYWSLSPDSSHRCVVDITSISIVGLGILHLLFFSLARLVLIGRKQVSGLDRVIFVGRCRCSYFDRSLFWLDRCQFRLYSCWTWSSDRIAHHWRFQGKHISWLSLVFVALFFCNRFVRWKLVGWATSLRYNRTHICIVKRQIGTRVTSKFDTTRINNEICVVVKDASDLVQHCLGIVRV